MGMIPPASVVPDPEEMVAVAPVTEPIFKDEEEVWKAVQSVLEEFLREDQPQRDIEVAECKQHDLYWRGVQYAVWNEVAKDWQAPEQLTAEEMQQVDPEQFSRVINIVKAFGESYISSLSAGLPKTRFFPEDADNPDDLSTAKGASRVSDLIEQHNQAELMLLKMLWLYYKEGLIAVYNYNREDENYGISKIVKGVEFRDQTVNQQVCPTCGIHLGDDDSAVPAGMTECPNCGNLITPELQPFTDQVPVLSFDERPKSREIIEIYGATHIRIAPYASEQAHTPYLVLEFDQHHSLLRHIFTSKRDKIGGGAGKDSDSRWGRLSQVAGANKALSTVRLAWLRPWAFEREEKERAAELKKLFPAGCKIVIVDDEPVACEEAALDPKWTLSIDPLSRFIKGTPPVKSIINIQDITNDLVGLQIKNIDQSIPETFYDQELIDSEEYSRIKRNPGTMVPVRATPGQNLNNQFFTPPTATLSRESSELRTQLEQDSRFVMGIYPALYGGQQQQGSKTLGEYEMSKNQALQRLSITWKIINALWPRFMKKAVLSFIENMIGDEKIVQAEGRSFTNVWIKRAELNGRLGNVVSETNDQFPTSWVQKRGMLLELLNIPILPPPIQAALADPHNADIIHNTIAFQELHVPGEDDRDKQLAEISELLKGQPVPNPAIMQFQQSAMMGQIPPGTQPPPPQISSVPVMEELDNHQIEAATCRDWLISEVGQSQKGSPGWMNVYLHMTEHLNIMRAQAMAEQQAQMKMQMEAEHASNISKAVTGSTSERSSTKQIPDIEQAPAGKGKGTGKSAKPN